MSDLYKLTSSDFAKGAVMAVLTGFLLPVAAAIQTPNFSFATVNWHQVLVLAINGALVGFVGYISKNFLSDSQGKVFGKIG